MFMEPELQSTGKVLLTPDQLSHLMAVLWVFMERGVTPAEHLKPMVEPLRFIPHLVPPIWVLTRVRVHFA